jgi:hypothetical protein
VNDAFKELEAATKQDRGNREGCSEVRGEHAEPGPGRESVRVVARLAMFASPERLGTRA